MNMPPRPRPRRRAVVVLSAAAVAAAVAAAPAAANLLDLSGARAPQVLIGADNDDTVDPTLQPPGVAANQTLRRGDQLLGGAGSDLLIGRFGPDTLIANEGDDVLIGGLERASDPAVFPNFDIALGGQGDDVFVWAPGDGSDAFVGGEPSKWTTKRVVKVVRTGAKRVRVARTVRVRSKADDDVLVLGTPAVLAGDNSQPELFDTPFGKLPKVNVSGVNAPATVGTAPPQPFIKGFCEIVPAPPGLGYHHLVRFFVQDTGAQAVTIRVKDVERVLCRTNGADTITETYLGAKGKGPATVRTTDWTPTAASKLAALVG